MSSPPAPRIAIIYYSMYGHMAKMTNAIKAGIESKGGQATVYQIKETLDEVTLEKMGAPKKGTEMFDNLDPPLATEDTLTQYDAFLLGIPTRYGNMPAQWKAFWDHTGSLWKNGALTGKYVGVFVSTGTPGGGQETTVSNTMSTLVHHGMIFVPLGYGSGFDKLIDIKKVHGGSPWGAGTFAGSDGKRQLDPLELEIANFQGAAFFETVKRVDFRAPSKSSSEQ